MRHSHATGLALLALTLTACADPPTRDVEPAEAEPSAEAAGAPPLPRATNVTVATHAARFNDGELSTCVTVEVSAREVTDEITTVASRFLGGAVARVTRGPLMEGSTPLGDDQTCESQFADRTVFGSCAVAVPLEGLFEAQPNPADDEPLPNDVRAAARPYAAQFSARLIERHYSLDVVESDREMQTCMELRGEWDALPRDSREVRRARLDRSQRDLRRVLTE